QDVDHRLGAEMLHDEARRGGNGHGGIARNRLEQDAGQRRADFGSLFAHEETVFRIGDDYGGCIARVGDA
ncbi:hypothetical protein HMPREF0519_0240, partial [Lentilactobacillus hilgardii DSM 20176 = ATCC 8290]